MQIKKIITLLFCNLILTLIIVLPGILNRIFPSYEFFTEIYNNMRPYIFYIIIPLWIVLALFILINTGRMSSNAKFDKLSDIITAGCLIILVLLMAILLSMIIHLILSKYVQGYSGDLLTINQIKGLIIGGIAFVLLLCGYLYGNLLGRRAKLNNEDINTLIKKGESLTVEFKQTFFLDVKKKHEEEYIKKESLKNIAGFLNKNGGTLLIGVCDNGDIYGIENDNYKSDDDYLKRFKDIVKTSFIPSVLNLIHYEIVVIDNKKVLRVDCPRSDELIFLKGELDWAYVRTNPAVEKISGAALVDYARMREKEKIIDKK